MKIVLNKSHGGFNLSPAGINLYRKLIGAPVYFYEQMKFSARDKYNEWRKINDSRSLSKNKIYVITDKDYGWAFRILPEDIKFFNINTISRSDENLVKVVEQLGSKSFGKNAYLVIEDFQGDIFTMNNIKNDNGVETICK